MEGPVEFSCLYPLKLLTAFQATLSITSWILVHVTITWHAFRCVWIVVGAKQCFPYRARDNAFAQASAFQRLWNSFSAYGFGAANGQGRHCHDSLCHSVYADLDRLQFWSPNMWKHLVNFQKKKNVEALKKATKDPPKDPEPATMSMPGWSNVINASFLMLAHSRRHNRDLHRVEAPNIKATLI